MNPLDRELENGTYLIGARGPEQRVDYRTGYWVAEPQGLTTTYTPTLRQVAYAARTMGTAEGDYIGVWTGDDGVTYIDRAHHITTERSAIRLGAVFDQLAVWDCRNDCEIEIPKETTGEGTNQ